MRWRFPVATVVLALLVAGCGGGTASDAPAVYAASSLKQALPEIDGDATFAFAGSDTLALQIEQGAPADVFVSASPKYTDALATKGLCAPAVPIATNTLALIFPRQTPLVTSLQDLAEGGHPLALGDPEVPVGAYARKALAALGLSGLLERNPVSNEQDAAGIIAKVATGGAHAGIAYTSDAYASDDVVAKPLPAEAQPTIVYTACRVIRAGARSEAADAFIDALTGERGQEILTEAGLGPKP